jgi:Cation efflux system protein CusB domain 1
MLSEVEASCRSLLQHPPAFHHPAAPAMIVRTGQPVRVKVEAYPFTDDGPIAGRVDRISSDAIQDEKLGLAL